MNKLVDSILEWWEEHQCDSSGLDDDGWGEDCFLYNEPPEFVKIAQKMRRNEQT